MKKKGISAVVATVLIILITVVAVTIIWTAVIPMIKNQASFENELVDLSIDTTGGYTVWDEESGLMSVQVSRGADNQEVKEIDFIFIWENNSITERVFNIPGVNQKIMYPFYLKSLGKPIKVKISWVYADGKVSERVSEISSFSKGVLNASSGNFIIVNDRLTKIIASGTVKNNYRYDPEAMALGRNFLEIEGDLIPSVFGGNCRYGYEIVFTSGVELGKEYYTENCYNEGVYPGFQEMLDLYDYPNHPDAIVGDTFDVYNVEISCGNGACEPTEYCYTCPSDCRLCDDSFCDEDSDCWWLHCLHGVCKRSETFCGDFYCDFGETCENCLWDCGECDHNNGICESTEGCAIAPNDCGVCSCGDGVCNSTLGESANNCHADCGYIPCGDGVCDGVRGENAGNCAFDCGTSGLLKGHRAVTFKFANSYLPYRIMYPKNYDSGKSYPLVVSVSGSGGAGKDNVKQMEEVVFGKYLNTTYYNTEEFECFSVVPQIPVQQDYLGSQVPKPYCLSNNLGGVGGIVPLYHPNWPMVNEDGFFVAGVEALVQDLVDNPDININESRIYLTGFSYGGKATYELMKQMPDVWAAAWSVGGWAIGNNRVDYTGYSSDDLLIVQLEKEEEIYKNIPLRVGAGSADTDVFPEGGELACNMINSIGGSCVYNLFLGVDHTSSAGKAYGNETYVRWLFSQSK